MLNKVRKYIFFLIAIRHIIKSLENYNPPNKFLFFFCKISSKIFDYS
jgi:hypothetical protein